jgi:hypothetical protein
MTQDSKKKDDSGAVVEAVSRAKGLKRHNFPFVFIDGSEALVPFHKCGHALSMEGARGERYLDTEKEAVDPDRQRRIWIRRINLGLMEGWKFVDDMASSGQEAAQHDPDNKRIGVSMITSGDFATLEAAIFPGSESNDPAAIKKRVDAILCSSG